MMMMMEMNIYNIHIIRIIDDAQDFDAADMTLACKYTTQTDKDTTCVSSLQI